MDRFFRGLAAGFAGAVAMNLWSFFSYYVLQFSDLRFLDWAAIFVFGRLARTTLEMGLALFAQLIFASFLGILFAFLIPQVTSRLYLLKGMVAGLTAGFFIYAIPVLFKTPVLSEVSFAATLSNYIGIIIWGLVTAYALSLLSKEKLEN